MFFKQYIYGDTAVYYVETPIEGHEGKTTVGIAFYPKDVKVEPKKLCLDSLVQVAFTGDEALIDYTLGVTMRNHSSTALKVVRQVDFASGNLNTYLTDGEGNDFIHTLTYDKRTGVFTTYIKYENRTKKPRTLEHLSSFSMSGIAGEDGTTRGLKLHRMTSAWSRECRLRTDPFSHLGMEMSWARYGVKVEKWGQNGSMPNRGWFPFAAIEDEGRDITWAVMPEAPYSWQMEVYEEKETCALSGGLADYETGHWRKTIPAGGFFTTHCARITVKRGGLNAVCNALIHEQERRLAVPASENDMPVLYNEYCATWGSPTEEKITKQLAAVAPLGVKYFVIDCGWYKPLDKGWCNAIGDWNINPEYFPDMRRTVDAIKEKGMKAGIWFEFEVAGRDSELFTIEEALLKRDGALITSKNRRFLDLRKESVRRYLDRKVTDMLTQNGFEYIKIDYNDNIGIGCDGDDSLGEGGRQVTEESLAWLKRLSQAVPGLVIENCSSGGSRIEPLRMGLVSMCSFSDAHECPEIPLVAANVSRVVPARQSQIWAVIRKKEPDSRTIYSLCAAMLGRICLSGEINPRQKEKYAVIKEGLDFYSDVKDIVRNGDIRRIDCNVENYRAPVGRQIYVKDYFNRRLVVVHFLDCNEEVELPLEGYSVQRAYTDLAFSEDEAVLKIQGEAFHAGAFLLERAV